MFPLNFKYANGIFSRTISYTAIYHQEMANRILSTLENVCFVFRLQ